MRRKEENINVLLVEAGKAPRMAQISSELKAMQQTVGGNIEMYMPFYDRVAIICNDEGKLDGSVPNRAIYMKDSLNENDKQTSPDHEIADIIYGDFFIAYAPSDSEYLHSLPEDMQKKYSERFKYPEMFARIDDTIMAFSIKPSEKDVER